MTTNTPASTKQNEVQLTTSTVRPNLRSLFSKYKTAGKSSGSTSATKINGLTGGRKCSGPTFGRKNGPTAAKKLTTLGEKKSTFGFKNLPHKKSQGAKQNSFSDNKEMKKMNLFSRRP